MERHPPTPTTLREPALAWLRQPAAVGVPDCFAGPQAAWALETWLLGGAALAELEDRSAFGESIAARSLAAVHAVIVALSGGEERAPRADLRGRLLASAERTVAERPSQAPTVVPSSGASPDPELVSSVVAVGRKHAGWPSEVGRSASIARLDADRREGDAELEELLARVDAWLDFPLLVVSVVHAGETVHRAYRTSLLDPPRVVPREASYCTHCVAGDAPLIVEDARVDAFFAHHPAVAAFGLVAYCGVPVRVGIGTGAEAVVGTLCAYDVRPRAILVEDAAALEVFARRVASIIEGRRDDPAWSDAGSRGEEREVLAPGPMLDLALVALRRGDAALLVGPAVPSIPHAASFAREGFAITAGRLGDGRSAWLVHTRRGGAADHAALATVAEQLAEEIATRLDAPIGVSVRAGGDRAGDDAPADVEAWIARAAGRPNRS